MKYSFNTGVFKIKNGLFYLYSILITLAMNGASAQNWPAKPVRIVVPFPAGGAVDTVTRNLSQQISESLKQPFLIENKPGAGAIIGADAVAKSNPDGYTLLLTTHGLAIAPSLYKKLPFDAKKDFTAVTQIMSSYLVLAVGTTIGVNNFSDFLNAARVKPNSLNYGSTGLGSAPHLVMELLKQSANLELTHIPYKGDAPMNQALLSGYVGAAISPLSGVINPMHAGKLKIIAMTGTKRSEAIPDVPTISESGVPNFEHTGWLGLFAPAGTQLLIARKIQAEFTRVLNSPEIKGKLPNWGYEAVGSTPENFSVKYQQDLLSYAKAIKDAHIELQD